MTIIKNPLTIVKQETQTVNNSVKSFEPNSSPQHVILLPNGSWYKPQGSYCHGTLMSNQSTELSFNPSQYDSFRFISKINANSFANSHNWMWSSSGSIAAIYPVIDIEQRGGLLTIQTYENGSDVWHQFFVENPLQTNTDYYLCVSYDDTYSSIGVFVYDKDGFLLEKKTFPFDNNTSGSGAMIIGGSKWGNTHLVRGIYIDLTETVIEAGGTVLWGQHNDKTQYMGIITPDE